MSACAFQSVPCPVHGRASASCAEVLSGMLLMIMALIVPGLMKALHANPHTSAWARA
jgi:hypothetical protein